MTDQDLQHWLSLSEKASPGPWGADFERQGRVCDGKCGDPIPESPGYGPASTHVHCSTIATDMDDHLPTTQAFANAEFIAVLRTIVPALIAEVKKLRVLVDPDVERARLAMLVDANDAARVEVRARMEATYGLMIERYAGENAQLRAEVEQLQGIDAAPGADASGIDITFRLRGFLGGSGTAMTALATVPNRLDLWRVLRDAANEIDRLNATIVSAAGQRP